MPTAGFLFLLLGMEACPQTSLEKFVGSQNIVRFTTLLMTETYATRRKIMIRTIVFALLGLALASTAQAMPISRAYQPDNMITQARMGCGVGMVMVNGACRSRAGMRQEHRANRRCVRYTGGVCVH